jgi:branched-chain amino acid transport system permease protein
VGLVFAVLVGLIIAISFGYMLLRLKGVYFFIATTAFAEAILVIFTRFIEPFGGAAGIRSVPPPTPFGIPGLFMTSFTTKLAMFYFAFILVLVLVLMVYRLEKGRLGEIWTGIQQAPLLAEASGINTMNYKIVAFALGSALAAAAGAFQCHYTNQVNPGAYGMYTIINYIVWTMVGGSNVFIGPIIGATCLTLLAEWLSFYESLIPYQPIIYSLTLILVILFLPDGLASLPVKVSAWYNRKRGQNI